jgi:hypothetical protein
MTTTINMLVRQAEQAGLRLRIHEGKLKLSGPKAQAGLATEILRQAEDVKKALRRRACFRTWETALGRIATAWEQWRPITDITITTPSTEAQGGVDSGEGDALGTSPYSRPWLPEEIEDPLTADVRTAILAADLPATEQAVGQWTRAWTQILYAEGEVKP